jgi:hypothetical protein
LPKARPFLAVVEHGQGVFRCHRRQA